MKFSRFAAACIIALTAGCATRPPPEGPLASLQSLQAHTLASDHQQHTGRFGLKASFLSEPIQGRFDWRKPRQGPGPELLELLNPWGELQVGLGRLRGPQAQLEALHLHQGLSKDKAPTSYGTAGIPISTWQVFNHRGEPVDEQTLDRWASGLGLDGQSLLAFFQLVNALEPSLSSPANPQPLVQRMNTGEGWLELRLIADPCCN